MYMLALDRGPGGKRVCSLHLLQLCICTGLHYHPPTTTDDIRVEKQVLLPALYEQQDLCTVLAEDKEATFTTTSLTSV